MNARAMVGALCALVAFSFLSACGSSSAPLTPSGVAGTTGGGAGTAAAGTTGAGGSAFDAGSSPDTAAAGTGAPDAGVDGGGPFVFSAVAGCSKDGWCWSTPAPQGNSLYSVFGSGPSDVWAVGEYGTIVHYDGAAWTLVPSGETRILRGVWAPRARDAWAVGEYDTILRWDGTSWSRAVGVPGPGYHWYAVWGTSSTDLWIVGTDSTVAGSSSGVAIHWNGAAWKKYAVDQPLNAVWGTGADDVWVLDADHGLYQWDGELLSHVPGEGLPQIGTGVWGPGARDVWLTGRSAALPSHWDGDVVEATLDQSGDLDGLWGSGPNDVWAVGSDNSDTFSDRGLILHWDGLSWKRTPSPGASHLYDVWGSRADDVWAVGESGELIHWNGRAWSAPAGPPLVDLFHVWSSSPDDVCAFGFDRRGLAALRWDGRAWTAVQVLSYAAIGANAAGNSAPYAAWGSAPDDIWVGAVNYEAIGDTGNSSARTFFVHWDGRAWALVDQLPGGIVDSFQVASMWGSGPKDVWAVGTSWPVGTGVALRWDGSSWTQVSIPTPFTSPFRHVWSSGPNDVWIGADGALLHWNGTSWSDTLMNLAGGSFVIGGTGPGDVWVATEVADGATRLHHFPTGESYSVPLLGGPVSIAAISPTNVWVRGYESMVHWDGVAWKESDAGSIHLGSNLRWDGKQLWTVVMRGLIRHP